MRIIAEVIMFTVLALMISIPADAADMPFLPKYNVIIVSIDALQARHLRSHGYPLATTPNLDRFLTRAYLFKNALTPAPWTTPSHMSIFTSWYPSEHKVVNQFVDSGTDGNNIKMVTANLKELSPAAVTLAQILKKNGYVTAGFTGDAGLKATHGHGQGFDKFYDETKFGGLDTSQPLALEWLEKNKDKRFFLFLHGYDVHGMYAPANGFDFRYVKKPYNGKYTGSTAEWNALRREGLAGPGPILSDDDTAFWRAIYDEKISLADEQFGKLLQYLRKNGLMENSIIVVLSDHGTAFLEHGKFYHGNTLYGELVDVLLAIRVPGQEKGAKIESLVSTLDVAPTILSILGIKGPSITRMKGIDLTPATRGKDVSRDIFIETDYLLYTHKRGIQTPDGWKMILTMEDLKRELYNLKTDPGERVNLAEKEPKITYELEQKIYRHLKEMKAGEGPWRLGCPPELGDKCKPI